MRPHHAAHQDVADAVIDGVVIVDPVLLDEPALHSELRGDRRYLARVVRLDAADRHQRVAPLRERIGHEVFHLPHLVAAEGEAGIAVLALGEDFDLAAEMPRQAIELFDRRRAEGERVAREILQGS